MSNVYWPLSEPDTYGGMVGADDVRDNVKATILTWAPTYLAVLGQRLAAAGRLNVTGLAPFGTWVNEPTYRSFGSGQPAAFLVKVPGTLGTPELQGNRMYIATWRCEVTVQVFGTTWEEAADLVSWYEKVVRWCIIQHRDLGGFAQSTKWAGATYSGKIHTGTRTEAEAVIGFDVTVGNVVTAGYIGPTPSGPDPTVDQTIVTLTKVPDTQPV